ncbi:hypothetical protein CSB20_08540 [bacterium DOLZORAL124_64_63]|nr:MAG: hypothetical protein CSB20_08540 [bacterium DOLZORAL124_64_63]
MEPLITLAEKENAILEYDLESRRVLFRIAGTTISLCSCCLDQMADLFYCAHDELELLQRDQDPETTDPKLAELFRSLDG